MVAVWRLQLFVREDWMIASATVREPSEAALIAASEPKMEAVNFRREWMEEHTLASGRMRTQV